MENQMEKENYYIFFNIDGSLWDYKQGAISHGPYLFSVPEPKLSRESLDALNMLIASLENKYNTSLVITSGRRKDLEKCTRYLSSYGLEYDKPIFAIPYPSVESRGKSIVDFMQSHGEQPIAYGQKKNFVSKFLQNAFGSDYKNYVVVESRKSLLNGMVPPQRTILTNHKKRSLTPHQVAEYLRRNDIEIVCPAPKNEPSI